MNIKADGVVGVTDFLLLIKGIFESGDKAAEVHLTQCWVNGVHISVSGLRHGSLGMFPFLP